MSRFGAIHRFVEIDSTNTWLLDQARAGAPEGTVAVADHQSAGRGRLGRRWIAPPGASLLLSVLLRPVLSPAQPPAGGGAGGLHLLTVAVALAAADACRDVAGVEVDLKWPNDLLVGDRKVAGILAESVVEGGKVTAVVVGLGLNVNWPPDLPEEIATTATALNLAGGRPASRDDVLDALLGHLDLRYPPGPGLAEEYRRRCVTVGKRVRVELPAGTFEGAATGIADDGSLVVDTDGEERTVSAGDVVHLRLAD